VERFDFEAVVIELLEYVGGHEKIPKRMDLETQSSV